MAVRINPCHGCPVRDGCEQRHEFRRRVSGLGLRSATFRCDRLAAELRRGRRVLVPTPRLNAVGGSYEPEFRTEMVAAPATITGSSDGWFSCVIDPGHVYGRVSCNGDAIEPEERFRFRRRMRAARIVRFLDEPDRSFCGPGKLLLPSGECDRLTGEDCLCSQVAEARDDMPAALAPRPTGPAA